MGQHLRIRLCDVRGGVRALLLQAYKGTFEVDAEHLGARPGSSPDRRQGLLVEALGRRDDRWQVRGGSRREQGCGEFGQARALRGHVDAEGPVHLQVDEAGQDQGPFVVVYFIRFGDERVIRAHVRDGPFTEKDRALGPHLVIRNDLAPQRDEPHVAVLRLSFPLMAYIFRSRGLRIKGGTRSWGELVDVAFGADVGDAEEEEETKGHYDSERAYGDPVAVSSSPEDEEKHGR